MLFQLIIIQIVTFFAIVLILRKLLYAETARETQRLRVLREENSVKEKELAEKMQAAEGAYGERLAKAEEDVRELRAKTEKEVEELRKGTTDKAKEEAEEIISSAVNAREKMRDEIRNEVHKKIPGIAAQIFSEFLSPKVRQLTHRELLKEVVSQVGKTDKAKFNVKTKTGELISAYPLAKNEKTELLSSVFKKLGHKISFEEKEDKNLVAGVAIKLGTLVIDGSLENRLHQLEQK